MNRLSAGLITGAIGAVLLIILNFVQIPIVPYLVVLGVGIGAGFLVARNPKFASKTGGAGALAGLVAGTVLFLASVIGTVIFVNTPAGQSVITQVYGTVQAAQPTPGTGTSTSPVISRDAIQTFSYLGGCIAGLIYLGISTGLGAATGAIAGRGNKAAQVPLDANYPTFGAPPQGGMYPPQGQPPQTPYGSQQGGYPPPQQPPPQQ
ncbi:MAG: hypothetical protein H0X24_07775 [Ktedonobacterales bacterium]|nr:hypothetical protein [Ktedonobacterales bacterium]